jgi:S-adenosylmethionine hydrolase
MITLASDFGSPYPAAMRGVILGRCDARLVDVAHDLPRQDVRAAAFWLREVLPYFPPAVHLVVVDPGVGTDRAALVVRVGDHALVGPDNGVLFPPARRLAAEQGAEIECFGLAYDAPASTTFHGRDVFAPAAAEVHEIGVDSLHELDRLTPAQSYEDLVLPTATVERGEKGADAGPDSEAPIVRAVGEVLVVDDFGNAITNVPGEAVRDRDAVIVNGERVPVGRSFASVPPGERLVTVGSHGYAECDVNRGRGDEAFDLGPRDEVVFEFD